MYEPIRLKTEFNKNGFRYTQLKRTRYLAIYHQQLIPPKSLSPAGWKKAEYWEVWVIRIREATTIKEKLMSRRERMPSDEEWGIYAWTFYTAQGAEFRFNELLMHQKYAEGKEDPFSDEGQPHKLPCNPPGSTDAIPRKPNF
jgi:hypothetical protein